MSLILELFEKFNLPYTRKGKSFVTRCPFCKGDTKLSDHNAQINPDTNTMFCYTEEKLYRYSDFVNLLMPEKVAQVREEVVKRTSENAKAVKSQVMAFEEYLERMRSQGYKLIAEHRFYDLDLDLVYIKYRFERINDLGKKEKTFIYVKDGLIGLQGQRQIPYHLEEFVFYSDANEVWICEGEKCADTIIEKRPDIARIIVISINQPSELKSLDFLLSDKKFVIFEDNDEAGRKKTEELIEILKPYADEIKVVRFEEFEKGYDVADFLETHSWEDLLERVLSAESMYKSPIHYIYHGIQSFEKEEDFLLEPFIPRKSITLFDGIGGLGKSILAMQLALCVATEACFLETSISPHPSKVLYITAEETEWIFNERLKKICNALQLKNREDDGIFAERLKNFAWFSTLSKSFPLPTHRLLQQTYKGIEKTQFYTFLEDIIDKYRPELVVLDSLANFYGLEENLSSHASAFFEVLKNFCKNYDLSFLLIHHQTKEAMKEEGALQKLFRGSTVFREQSRCRILLEKGENEGLKLFIEKLNYPTDKPLKYHISLFSTETELCFKLDKAVFASKTKSKKRSTFPKYDE
ncbi:MAG: AAA family ATPase [Candidatus Aenigmatarchaeota archaeon]